MQRKIFKNSLKRRDCTHLYIFYSENILQPARSFFGSLANMYTRESDAANHLAHSYKSFKALKVQKHELASQSIVPYVKS